MKRFLGGGSYKKLGKTGRSLSSLGRGYVKSLDKFPGFTSLCKYREGGGIRSV